MKRILCMLLGHRWKESYECASGDGCPPSGMFDNFHEGECVLERWIFCKRCHSYLKSEKQKVDEFIKEFLN